MSKSTNIASAASGKFFLRVAWELIVLLLILRYSYEMLLLSMVE